MLKNRVIIFVWLVAFSFTAQAGYECVGADDCQQRWWRTISWLQENAKFKIKFKGDDVLEAKARTPAHKNRLEYRVEKKALGGERWLLSAQASCRISTGCPSAEKKLDKLFAYIASPLVAQASVSAQKKANADSLPEASLSPIQLHLREQGCAEQSPVHTLRVSWAGQLFEAECIRAATQREALVVRCRAEQCRSLK